MSKHVHYRCPFIGKFVDNDDDDNNNSNNLSVGFYTYEAWPTIKFMHFGRMSLQVEFIDKLSQVSLDFSKKSLPIWNGNIEM